MAEASREPVNGSGPSYSCVLSSASFQPHLSASATSSAVRWEGVSDHSLSRDSGPNHSHSQRGLQRLSNLGLTKHEVTFPLLGVSGLFGFTG